MLRVIGLLVVVGFIGFVIGLSLDWFRVDSRKDLTGDTEYRVVVDDEKIEDDTRDARAKTKEIVDDVKNAVGRIGDEETVRGDVAGTSLASRELRVRTDDSLVAIDVPAGTDITINGEVASLGDLAVGDRVVADCKETDDARLVASTLRVTRG